MANALVKFPVSGDEWEEVKDGPGMYVLAVLPLRGVMNLDPHATASTISILRPPGTLLTPVAPLWPTEESRSYDIRLIEEAVRLFEEKGERAKASVMRAQLPITDMSVEMLNVTWMGAMRCTLKSKKTGDYWQAGWSDLTPAGILHMHQVEVGFTRAPTLLTFLGEEVEDE